MHTLPKCQYITMHSSQNTSVYTTQNISNYSIPQHLFNEWPSQVEMVPTTVGGASK